MHDQKQSRLPNTFHRIRLERAREAGRPEGDRRIAYSFIAPLRPDGLLDADAARTYREACVVTRFRPGTYPEEGYLRRRPGGSWAFHYDLGDEEDDDPGYRLGEHRFAPGEYVTLIEDDGEHTYRVVAVESV